MSEENITTTNTDHLIDLGEKLRHAANEIDNINRNDPQVFNLSASIGIYVNTPGVDISLDAILEKADKLLYEAKKKRSKFIERK